MNILLPIIRRARRPFPETATIPVVAPKAEELKAEALKTDSEIIKPAKKKNRVETTDH